MRLYPLSVLFLVVIPLVFSSCKSQNSEYEVKEFEFSQNICSDIVNATNSRWDSKSGISKLNYFNNLVVKEAQILDYELPRYRKRMSDIASGVGPANGPGGVDTNNANASEKFEEEQPVFGDDSSQGLKLQTGGGTFGPDTALAKEVCPGCDKNEIQKRLSRLEVNTKKISTCTFPEATNAASVGENGNPVESDPNKEKLRQKLIFDTSKLIAGLGGPKHLCNWLGTWMGGQGASRNRCLREATKGVCAAGSMAVIGATTSAIAGTDSGESAAVLGIGKGLPNAVKQAVKGCMQQLAYDQLKKAIATYGTREVLSESVRKRAQKALSSDTKKANLKKDIAMALCKAGTNLVANQIDATPQINYDNPCRAMFSASKSRAKACLKTT